MQKIANKIKNNSTLFSNFVENLVRNPSHEVQKNFMDITSKIAETIRRICNDEGLIFDVSYEGKNYWLKGKNYEACFVDGGVYSSFASSSAPFAIRAKSYIVKPNKSLLERERFEEAYRIATAEPHGFLFIRLRAKDKSEQLWSTFTKRILD